LRKSPTLARVWNIAFRSIVSPNRLYRLSWTFPLKWENSPQYKHGLVLDLFPLPAHMKVFNIPWNLFFRSIHNDSQFKNGWAVFWDYYIRTNIWYICIYIYELYIYTYVIYIYTYIYIYCIYNIIYTYYYIYIQYIYMYTPSIMDQSWKAKTTGRCWSLPLPPESSGNASVPLGRTHSHWLINCGSPSDFFMASKIG
jgi:hypothetical protein